MSYVFDHESLHAYQIAVPIARELRKAKFPPGDADLADQARRASQSMALNIAEGRARTGKSRLHHYAIAHGSAAELCAVLDLVEIPNHVELQVRLRRVGLLLHRLR